MTSNLKPSGYGDEHHRLLAYSAVSGIGKVRKHLGENIRSCRTRAGFSQEKLAEKADLHPVYISQVERGHKAVSVEALWKISKSLRTPISELFTGL